MTLNLSEEVLRRRVYNEAVNQKLQKNTILSALEPYCDKDKWAIDVGAATGYITNFLAPRFKKVVAFEAVEPVYHQLQKMEQKHSNVTAIHAAVSAHNAEMATIYVDDKRLSNSGFRNLVGGPATLVTALRLDSLFTEDNPIGFIKIDVEGTEFDVILGAREIIESQLPALMVEIYKPFSALPVSTIFAFLMERGYKAHYYQHGVGLVGVPTVADGVLAVENLHHIHDGDFLFVA